MHEHRAGTSKPSPLPLDHTFNSLNQPPKESINNMSTDITDISEAFDPRLEPGAVLLTIGNHNFLIGTDPERWPEERRLYNQILHDGCTPLHVPAGTSVHELAPHGFHTYSDFSDWNAGLTNTPTQEEGPTT